MDHPTTNFENIQIQILISFFGHPIIAILSGVIISILLAKDYSLENHYDWFSDGLKAAGSIILITGAGGAFGNILRSISLGDYLSQILMGYEIGLFLPFIIAALLKTAQGSSTVSIITTSAMVLPLLNTLGLSSEMGKVIAVLSIGAGAMTFSHLNDSYFWVVAQFSNMDTNTAIRCHAVTTLLQGATAIILIQLLSMFF